MKTRLCSLVAAGGLVLVSACAKQESVREIDWAKAALARNPAYEIVATDESAGVFTVRDTTTGRCRDAAPRRSHRRAAAAQDWRAQPAPAAASPAAEPVEPAEAAADSAATLASDQTTEPEAANGRAAGRRSPRARATASTRGDAAPPTVASHARRPGLLASRARIQRSVRKRRATPALQRRATHRSHHLPG